MIFSIGLFADTAASSVNERTKIHALYIPLADHYAALVAFEKYRDNFEYTNFSIQQMASWDLLRAYFQEGDVDMAFVMSPLAMDMYRENPHFKWIGLMHRDGNALAVNDVILERLDLPDERAQRKPSWELANVLSGFAEERGSPTYIKMPHILSTHSVVLYRYLKEHNLDMVFSPGIEGVVLAGSVAPAHAPSFIRGMANRATPAAFEQSLPWADIVETEGYGRVAWYSKDVMPWPGGHVECIVLANNKALAEKSAAVQEVMAAIKDAGAYIERARQAGGDSLDEVVGIIQKHIPQHTRSAIIASLNPDLRVINYDNLSVDKLGLQQIMEYAVEAGILRESININEFSAPEFSPYTQEVGN